MKVTTKLNSSLMFMSCLKKCMFIKEKNQKKGTLKPEFTTNWAEMNSWMKERKYLRGMRL